MLALSPHFVSFHVRVGNPQQRVIAAFAFAASQQIADNVVGLDWSAALGVAQHRGGKCGARRGQHGPAARQDRLAGRKAARGGNRRALIEQGNRLIDAICRHDVADRGSHQTGDAGSGRNEYPLFPHFLKDCRAEA